MISPAKHPLEGLLNEAGQINVKTKFSPWHKLLVIKKRTCTETAEAKHTATSIQRGAYDVTVKNPCQNPNFFLDDSRF